MTDNAKVIEAFLECWSRYDPDEMASYFTEDAVWEDGVPSEPYRGRQAIREQIARYARHVSDVSIEIVTQVSSGNLVMHERIDRLTRRGRRMELKAVGVFELEGGKIKSNRDYWNPGAYAPPQ